MAFATSSKSTDAPFLRPTTSTSWPRKTTEAAWPPDALMKRPRTTSRGLFKTTVRVSGLGAWRWMPSTTTPRLPKTTDRAPTSTQAFQGWSLRCSRGMGRLVRAPRVRHVRQPRGRIGGRLWRRRSALVCDGCDGIWARLPRRVWVQSDPGLGSAPDSWLALGENSDITTVGMTNALDRI